MTIFVEITQQFLRGLFLETCQASIDADNPARRNVLFWHVTPRDTKLSLDKRERLQGLIAQLKQYVSDKSDADALADIKALITQCKTDAAKLATDKQFDEGRTGTVLAAALLMVQSFYDKLNTLQLLDICKDDAQAFSVFQYYIAVYCSHMVIALHNLGKIGQFAEHPQLSCLHALNQQKEEAISTALSHCQRDCDLLDSTHEGYPRAVIRQVLFNIEALLRHDLALCNAQSMALNALLRLLEATRLYQSTTLQLQLCMNAAIGDIANIGVIELDEPSPTASTVF